MPVSGCGSSSCTITGASAVNSVPCRGLFSLPHPLGTLQLTVGSCLTALHFLALPCLTSCTGESIWALESQHYLGGRDSWGNINVDGAKIYLYFHKPSRNLMLPLNVDAGEKPQPREITDASRHIKVLQLSRISTIRKLWLCPRTCCSYVLRSCCGLSVCVSDLPT